MMQWEKKGLIFDKNTFALPWFSKNAMVPVPYQKDAGTIRLFCTFCDEQNIGRIGYVDVKADYPTQIIGYSKTPVVNIGIDGKFDDNGVVTASVYEEDGKLYLFYSSYQLCKKIPYMIFCGVAVSADHGDTFEKITEDVPFLDRIAGEPNFRCIPNIMKSKDTYQMWYLADVESEASWAVDENGHVMPIYAPRYMESDKLLRWDNRSQEVLELNRPDEHGISIGTVWEEEGKYHCIYSIRSFSKGYRLGYAESLDGKKFNRMDEVLNLDVSAEGFDSEMICFPNWFEWQGRIYVFYSGNHFGMDGVGVAELISKS